MLASSDVLWPNSGRPSASFPAVMLVLGVEKFARSKMLNNCAMNSSLVRPAEPEELRESQVHVREARAVHRRDLGQSPARPERVDRREVERAAPGCRARPRPAGRRCSRRRSGRARSRDRRAGSIGSPQSRRPGRRRGAARRRSRPGGAGGRPCRTARPGSSRTGRRRCCSGSCPWPARSCTRRGTGSGATCASPPSPAAPGRCCPRTAARSSRVRTAGRASPGSPGPAG